jgi:diguanylate cyclase (GGDEF)-like protein
MGEDEVVKLKEEIERLQKLVFYDELTGVMNRRGFKEEAEKLFLAVSFVRRGHEQERRNPPRMPFSLLFVDLDDFKIINDTYGHEAGDTVLREVASMLENDLRSSDVVGRWGGEEFVVGLVGADHDIALRVAGNILEGIRKIVFDFDGRKTGVTASIGVATYEDQESLDTLIQEADEAMYEAKKSGKNRVVNIITN